MHPAWRHIKSCTQLKAARIHGSASATRGVSVAPCSCERKWRSDAGLGPMFMQQGGSKHGMREPTVAAPSILPSRFTEGGCCTPATSTCCSSSPSSFFTVGNEAGECGVLLHQAQLWASLNIQEVLGLYQAAGAGPREQQVWDLMKQLERRAAGAGPGGQRACCSARCGKSNKVGSPSEKQDTLWSTNDEDNSPYTRHSSAGNGAGVMPSSTSGICLSSTYMEQQIALAFVERSGAGAASASHGLAGWKWSSSSTMV